MQIQYCKSTNSNMYCQLFVQDAGLLPVLQMSIHQPFTVFWPTDEALNSLPAERQRWLSSPDHQEQLTATVKAHIVRSSRVGKGGVWLDQIQSSEYLYTQMPYYCHTVIRQTASLSLPLHAWIICYCTM